MHRKQSFTRMWKLVGKVVVGRIAVSITIIQKPFSWKNYLEGKPRPCEAIITPLRPCITYPSEGDTFLVSFLKISKISPRFLEGAMRTYFCLMIQCAPHKMKLL
jgi:hypothetical protein